MDSLFMAPTWTETHWSLDQIALMNPANVVVYLVAVVMGGVTFTYVDSDGIDHLAPTVTDTTDIGASGGGDRQPPPPYLPETSGDVYRPGLTELLTPDPEEQLAGTGSIG